VNEIPSCMRASRNYVIKTRRRFTVVIQCVDPPVPCFIFNTDDRQKAGKLFKRLKDTEIENLGGGEFTITWYEHDGPYNLIMIKCWRLKAEESDSGEPYVYAILYENSRVVEEFSYVDMHAALQEKYDGDKDV